MFSDYGFNRTGFMNILQSIHPLQDKPILANLATFSQIFSHRGVTFFKHYSKSDFPDNFEGSSIYIGNVVSALQNKPIFSHFSHFVVILATPGSLDG